VPLDLKCLHIDLALHFLLFDKLIKFLEIHGLNNIQPPLEIGGVHIDGRIFHLTRCFASGSMPRTSPRMFPLLRSSHRTSRIRGHTGA